MSTILDVDGIIEQPRHPGRVDNTKLQNDYENNGHNDSRDPQFRWNGPATNDVKRGMSNECLAALRDAATAKRAPLNDEERADILARFQ